MLTWLNARIAQSGHLSITNLMLPNEIHAPVMFCGFSGSKPWPKTIMVWKDIRIPTWATESQNHKKNKISGALVNYLKKVICVVYMTKLVLENEQRNDMCCNEIGLRGHNIDIILGPIINTIGRICCYVIFWKERENLHYDDLLWLVHLNCNFKTHNDNMHDSQSLSRRGNSLCVSTIENCIWSGKRAHSRAT